VPEKKLNNAGKTKEVVKERLGKIKGIALELQGQLREIVFRIVKIILEEDKEEDVRETAEGSLGVQKEHVVVHSKMRKVNANR